MARTLRRSDRGLLSTFNIGLVTGIVVGSWAGLWRGILVAILVLGAAYLVLRVTTSVRKTPARGTVNVP